MLLPLLLSLKLFAAENCHPVAVEPFVEWVKSFRYHQQCAPLRPGEGRVFQGTRGTPSQELPGAKPNSSTFTRPNDTNYLLRRHGEKDFEIIFNTRFHATTTSPAEVKRMEERVKRCFALASPHMRGSQGEQIRLKAITTDKEEGALRPNFPPKIHINVLAANARGNAENFSLQAGCPFVVHEFLHHAGLCDEYHESTTGTVDKENAGACRVVMPNDSIMAGDMWEVFDASVGEHGLCEILPEHPERAWLEGQNDETLRNYFRKNLNFVGRTRDESYQLQDKFCQRRSVDRSAGAPFEALVTQEVAALRLKVQSDTYVAGKLQRIELSCACVAEDQECQRFLQRAKADAHHYSKKDRAFYSCPQNLQGVDQELPKGEIRVASRSPLRIELHSSGRGGGLLHPTHFAKLINGDCRNSITERYDQCAVWAYSFSQPSTDCAQVPSHCRTPEGFLGSQERLR